VLPPPPEAWLRATKAQAWLAHSKICLFPVHATENRSGLLATGRSANKVSLGLFAGEGVFFYQESNFGCQVSRGKAMTTKVALLRRSGKRPGVGGGAKSNRVVGRI